jgi:hypothetical protein
MRIEQLNNRQGTNKQGKMAKKVAETMNIDLASARELLKRLAQDTAVDMSCNKVNFTEERRVWWTTYSNLELWFATWERQLLSHSLMVKDIQGRSRIPREKLRQKLNFDETSLLLDGSSIN